MIEQLVFQNEEDLYEAENGRLFGVSLRPIHIHLSWINSYLAPLPNANGSNGTVLSNFILSAWALYATQAAASNISISSQTFASILFAKILPDGLARIGSEFSITNRLAGNLTVCRGDWCSQGPVLTNISGEVSIPNGTWAEWYQVGGQDVVRSDNASILQSFPKPANASALWTKVSLPVHRYAYRWGFSSITSKVAAAILLLHAIVAIIHCAVLLASGDSYSYAASLGELVALALGSRPSDEIASTSAGIDVGSTWAQTTAVREVEVSGGKDWWLEDGKARLELRVGNDVDNRRNGRPDRTEEGSSSQGEVSERQVRFGKKYH